MALKVIGRSVTRNDVVKKVTGKAKYGQDITLLNMLYGKLLPSPYAFAKIVRIDVTKAKELPGVRAVLTGQDVHCTFGSVIKDRPVLAKGIVRYQGEPIAAVAAETEAIAQEAVELIEIEYEEMQPLLDPCEAMTSSLILHPQFGSYACGKIVHAVPGTNICSHYKLRKGNMDKGFCEADRIIEGAYSTQMIQHAFIEPISAVAESDPCTKQITIWSTACNPFVVRKEVASAFGLPVGKVRIIVTDVGGSFGGKLYAKVEPHAAALSFACGYPVRIVLTREELFNIVVRGPAHFKIKTGIKNDGTIVARQVESVWDTGAYAECGPTIARNSGHTSAGPYRIPNIQVDAYCVYTNNNIGGAFRGYGVQEATWATECHMDDIACELGISPFELRKKNLLHYGDVGSTGQIVECTGLEECLDSAWDALNRTEKNGGTKLIGRGLACLHKATLSPSSSSAVVNLNEDGTAIILTSATEQGQGTDTILAQIVAEELGLSLGDVSVSGTDTSYTPYDTTTSGSRSTYSMGNAVLLAAQDIKKQLLEIAARHLNTEVNDLSFVFGKLQVKSQPDKSYTIKEIVSSYFALNGTIIGRGFFRPPSIMEDPETGQTPLMTPFWMYGAQAAEVEVDTETGEVKILKFVAAHDLGRVLNPLNCRQQIEGGVVQGIGGALYEEMKISHKGITLNPNLHDYKIPTSMDITEIETIIVESQQKDGPFGAKGVGEPILAATGPAIRNAILDAAGIKINDLPITAEKILAALEKKC